MKLLFTDIETTGFSREWDSIIEIAGIIVDSETMKEIATFHKYCKPRKPIPIQITEITGITDEMVKDADSESDVLEQFINFIAEQKPDRLVGHNIKAFDYDFYNKRAKYYFMDFPNIPLIDTLKIARDRKVPTAGKTKTGAPSYRQEFIAEAYGITYAAHSAIEDIKALIKIYKKMAGNDTSIEAEENKKAQVDRKRIKLGF